MTLLGTLRRLFGKWLVALGITAGILLAIAAPLAFSMQLETPMQLVVVTLAGVVLSFLFIRLGDLIADRVPRAEVNSERADLPKGREPRDRTGRATSPQMVQRTGTPARSRAI